MDGMFPPMKNCGHYDRQLANQQVVKNSSQLLVGAVVQIPMIGMKWMNMDLPPFQMVFGMIAKTDTMTAMRSSRVRLKFHPLWCISWNGQDVVTVWVLILIMEEIDRK